MHDVSMLYTFILWAVVVGVVGLMRVGSFTGCFLVVVLMREGQRLIFFLRG